MKTILIMILLALASVHCRQVYSGGPDPREEIPIADGGACWRSTAYPINPQQARLRDEKGWQEMPFDRRLEIAQRVAAKKAEFLYVPDYRICGDPVRQTWLHGAWFWRQTGKSK